MMITDKSAARRRLAVPWPAGGLRQFRGEAGRGTAAAAGDGRQAGGQGDRRDRRLHRPLRRHGRPSRLRARVNGYLESIHFTDGAIVKEGDLLFVIDQRPYQAALDAGRGRAGLGARRGSNSPRQELDRAERLVRSGNVAGALARRAPPAVPVGAGRRRRRAGRARRRRASTSTSPRSARRSPAASAASWSPRATSSAPTTTLLTTIVSLDPIHFYFDVDERSYLAYSRMARDGTRPSGARQRNIRSWSRSPTRASAKHPRPARLRRQPRRPGDRHDARPRPGREQGPAAGARHVRPRRASRAAARYAAC